LISHGATPPLDAKGAKIGGWLVCHGGRFISHGEAPALNANDVTIGGSLFCDGGQFLSRGATPALNVNGAKIDKSVLLRWDFKAEGGVDLTGATIQGNLECDGGQFINEGAMPALNADSAKIDASVFLREGMTVEGRVHFAYADVTHDFQWRGVKSPQKAILDLGFAKVGRLWNDKNSWPNKGNLSLGGFVYDEIDNSASPNADMQLGWLHRQPQIPFLSQPYEQLAGVLSKRGLKEDARKVMIEKNKDYAAHLHWRPAWLWYGFFGKIIGYGYSPWRAFWISLFVIGIGSFLFNAGYKSKLLTPLDKRVYVEREEKFHLSELYPRFNALVYSVETFVPLLKLGTSEYWAPNHTRHHGSLKVGNLVLPLSGRFLRYYLWFHIIAGWVLTSLWVGGLTGLVKT
jgi:hypothetical protein